MGYDLERLHRLYDEARFLDIHAETRSAWSNPPPIEALSIEELVFAGRVAGRLGGREIQRWLYRRAHDRDPTNPYVRYFARSFGRDRPTMVQLLREFEDDPRLDSGVPWLDASWLAHVAQLWGLVRDFERAHACLEEARALGAERAWIDVCAAGVLGSEGRWDESLEAAERAAAHEPGMPAVVSCLGQALVRCGHRREAQRRTLKVAETSQSLDVRQIALHHVGLVAERAGDAQRRQLADEATAMSATLASYAPLAGRACRTSLLFSQLDAAFLRRDRDAVMALAARIPSPYFRGVAHNLAERDPMPPVEARYLPVYQKHDTCLPTSIAAVAAAFDATLDPDEVARGITYGGTPGWRAAAWLREQGYAATHFVVTPDIAQTLLDHALPFVLYLQAVESSHAVAVVGMDAQAGTLLVHDPSTERLGRILADGLTGQETPFGPVGLAFVPSNRERELEELIPATSRQKGEAWQEHARLLTLRGTQAAAPIVEELAKALPDDPFPRLLRSRQFAGDGRLAESTAILEDLLRQHGGNPWLLALYLGNLGRTRDTALNQRTLARLVGQGLTPGITEGQPWRRPPPALVAQYADYLGTDAEGFAEAERMLLAGLRRAPLEPSLYHVLADVWSRQARYVESLVPFRVASLLADADDHYARSTANAYRHVGREAEGIAFLRRRARDMADGPGAGPSWLTLIDALEDFGRMSEAEAVARTAPPASEGHAATQAFLTGFWSRAGRWTEAERALERAAASGQVACHMEAATLFHERAGHIGEAIDTARRWIEAAPHDLRPRRILLSLVATSEGIDGVLEMARGWRDEHPGDEEVETLYLDWLREHERKAEYRDALRVRLARHPNDAWGWRELAHLRLDELRLGRQEGAAAAQAELDEAIAALRRLDPRSAWTRIVEAKTLEHDGRREDALAAYLDLLDAHPGIDAAVTRAWELAGSLAPEAKRTVADRIERALLPSVGHLNVARDLALQLAEQFGLEETEARLLRWREARPTDPQVIEALADLWLERGRGRTDVARARDLLLATVDEYPTHEGLRYSLAQACKILGDDARAEATFKDLLERSPRDSFARSRLAEHLAARGAVDEALALHDEGLRIDPTDAGAVVRAVTFLWEQGRREDALKRLRDGLRRNPGHVGLREQAIQQLLEAELPGEALAEAERGVEIHPHGAYLHLLLARTRRDAGPIRDAAAIESAYRRALELNEGLYEAADELAIHLAGLDEIDRAREVIERILPTMESPAPARGRLAWLRYREREANAAIEDMEQILREAPGYAWGWWTLLEWLRETQDWPRARRLLTSPPPAMATNVHFGVERLKLLRSAGVPANALDGEWDAFLQGHPDAHPLVLERFDDLWDSSRRDEAEQLLEAHLPPPRADAYGLVRWARVGARRRDVASTIEHVLTIWQRHDVADVWPSRTAWDAFHPWGARSDLIGRAVERLAAGEPLHPEAQRILTENASLAAPPFRLRHVSRYGTFLPGPLSVFAGLHRLLDLFALQAEQAHAGIEAALDAFVRAEGKRHALRWWRDHRAICAASTPLWAAAGRLLLEGPVDWRRQALEWLSDWRERPDAPMWSAANYVYGLLLPTAKGDPPPDLESIERVCVDALDSLPPDHTLRFLACTLCEARLRQYNDAAFMESYARYENVIQDEQSELWLPDAYGFLPPFLASVHELMRAKASLPAGDRRAARVMQRDARWRLKQRLGRDRLPRWAAHVWDEHLKK